MKYTVLLLAILLLSCSKKDSTTEPETKEGYIIDVKKNRKLTTGEIVAENTQVSVIHVWKIEGNNNVTIKNPFDAITGFAFDNTANKSVKANYTYVYKSHVSEQVPVGNYLVYVQLDESVGVGRQAYTYTTFQVKKGEFENLNKVFTSKVTTGSYEAWDKKE